MNRWFAARSSDWSPSAAQQTRWIVNSQLVGLRGKSRQISERAGILRRYDDKLAVVDRLRATAGRADATLQTLWLVVFGSTAEARPSIDGAAVPVSGPSEWVDITEAWLENRYRHLVAAATGH